MRFKRAFFLLQKDTDLTHVSYSSGYYDQSHFIRAFKKFSGHTPGEYLRIAG
jgi:AraC-like DNA-binding protein